MELELIKKIPEGLTPKSMELAVHSFVEQLHNDLNKDGIFKMTMANIVQSLVFGRGDIDIWVGIENSDVKSFCIANVAQDNDGVFCYWLTSPYISDEYKHTNFLLDSFKKLEKRAVALLCKRIILTTSRNGEALNKALEAKFVERSKIYTMDIN